MAKSWCSRRRTVLRLSFCGYECDAEEDGNTGFEHGDLLCFRSKLIHNLKQDGELPRRGCWACGVFRMKTQEVTDAVAVCQRLRELGM